jgi:hypothetical protein
LIFKIYVREIRTIKQRNTYTIMSSITVQHSISAEEIAEYQALKSKAVKDAMKNKRKEVPLENQCGKVNGKGKNCVNRGHDKFDGRCSGHSAENLDRLHALAKSKESKEEVPKTKCSHVNPSNHKKAPDQQCKFNTKDGAEYCGRHTPSENTRKRRVPDFEHVLRWALDSVMELQQSGTPVIIDDLVEEALYIKASLKDSRANQRHQKKSGETGEGYFLDEKEESAISLPFSTPTKRALQEPVAPFAPVKSSVEEKEEKEEELPLYYNSDCNPEEEEEEEAVKPKKKKSSKSAKKYQSEEDDEVVKPKKKVKKSARDADGKKIKKSK